MNIFYIALNTIKINFSDRKTLLTMLLFPIVLILILGTALKNVSDFSVTDLGKTTVYYYNEDNGEMGKHFEEFLKDEEVGKIIDLKKVSSYEEGTKNVDKDSSTVLLYLNKDYSNNITSEKEGKIQIYESKSNTIRNGVIKSLVDSFNNGANTVMVASKIAKSPVQYDNGENVSQSYISIDGKNPSAIDYYSITMLVLILMYGTNYGASELEELFYKPIGKRIKTTKTKVHEHLIGVVLGVISTLFIQALLLVIFTKYVYGANWGSHPLIVVAVMAVLSVLATSIGMLFMTLTGDAKKASSLIGVFVPVTAFVSGAYFKVPFMNSNIIKYVPNQLAHSALFDSIYNNNVGAAQSSILAMFIMSVIILVLASICGRRKLA